MASGREGDTRFPELTLAGNGSSSLPNAETIPRLADRRPVERESGQIVAEWRALARGKNGSWHAVAAASSEEAAIEAALTSCAQADQECRLHAIGNFRVCGTLLV